MARAKKEFDSSSNTLITTTRDDYIRVSDGELVTFDNIQKVVYGSKNFWKCYLMDFLSVLGIIDSKQLDVFIYIVENTNQATNLFIGTYAKISKEVGVSQPTIATIMKKLQEKDFVKKVQNGVWMVNANILMRGNDKKRQMLLTYYESDAPIDQITFSRTKRKEIRADQIPGQLTIGEKGTIEEE